MSFRVRSIAVAVVLAVSLADGATWVLAQGADALKFEVYQDSAKAYRWRLKGPDGIEAHVKAVPNGSLAKVRLVMAPDARVGFHTLSLISPAGLSGTGEVTVVSVKNVFEIGRALNPKMVEQQLVGGSWMGISHALYETTEPYYPNRDHGGTDFNQYLMPGPGDLADTEIIVLERPAADGPYGAKGPGEMCANPQIPAVANARSWGRVSR